MRDRTATAQEHVETGGSPRLRTAFGRRFAFNLEKNAPGFQLIERLEKQLAA